MAGTSESWSGPAAQLQAQTAENAVRRVVAVAVTYHPDLAVFLSALQASRGQVDHLIVMCEDGDFEADAARPLT